VISSTSGRRLAVLAHTPVARGEDGWIIKNRVGELIEEIADAGWHISLITRETERMAFMTHTISPRIRLRTISARPGIRDIGAFRGICRTLHNADAALVFHPSLMATILGLGLGSKAVVYAGHAWAHLDHARRWRSWLEAVLARRSTGVIAAGDALVARFEATGAPTTPCVPLVHPEVSRRLLASEPEEKTYDGLRLLYVGSVSEMKGARELLAVLRQLPNVPCRLVGPFTPDAAGQELRRDLDALPNVTLDGYLDWPELQERYEWATALILPSHTEGFPRAVYEATAFGLGVVVTPVGGIPNKLSDGRDALIVPVGDAAALEAALRSVASQPDRLGVMAAAARSALAPVFTDPTPGPQFDRALRQVVADRRLTHRRSRSAH